MNGDYKTDISFVVAYVRCYGSQLNFEHFGRRRSKIDHVPSRCTGVLKRNAL